MTIMPQIPGAFGHSREELVPEIPGAGGLSGNRIARSTSSRRVAGRSERRRRFNVKPAEGQLNLQ